MISFQRLVVSLPNNVAHTGFSQKRPNTIVPWTTPRAMECKLKLEILSSDLNKSQNREAAPFHYP